MNNITCGEQEVSGMKILSSEEIEQVSGGIPLMVGWAIAVVAGAAVGALASYIARKLC